MSILNEGQNCWRKARAARAAFLIDGAAYFEALWEAVKKAQQSLYIAAWDVDSRTELQRRTPDENPACRLGDFLNAVVKQAPELHVYILAWDFPMLYVREREPLPVINLAWKSHRRIHFELDSQHPIGGSQHQKIVVIDDATAFCGGIDLTKNRWDTPQHRLNDPRRKDPDGKLYPPFHDIQMIVEGEAASALGVLFRDRWKFATGKDLPPVDSHNSAWPSLLEPDVTETRIGIVRTLPAFKDRQEVRETENLYCDAIAAAQESIYIENQYLTSVAVARALQQSLQQEKGPEIAIVLPRESSGWLEQSTMDAVRARILSRLEAADHSNRLRILYPALAGGENCIYVHSKCLVVDDRLVLVGSANLSNRSMGLDSECSLVLEAEGHSKAAQAVAAFRSALLAEHLGTSSAEIRQAAGSRSLIRTIESASGANRSLRRLEHRKPSVDGTKLVPDEDWLDPEKPVELDRIFDQFVHDEVGPSAKLNMLKMAVVLLVLLALAAAWRWTPLSQWVSLETLAGAADYFKGSPLLPFGVLGGFVVAGLLMVPITVLIGATAIIFPPHLGVVYAFAGSLLSSLATYLIGAGFGRKLVRKLAGSRLNHLSKRLARQGILTIAVVRNLPLAPFTIVNMVAGASHIKLKDFLVGTALGMLPGILAITVFADRVAAAVRNPEWINIAVAGGIAIVLALGLWLTQKRLRAN
ncbi:MAG: VTT domain-containing protein [Desulfobacterales bacterium]